MHRLHGEHLAPECALERRQAGGDSGMLWALFCCPSVGCFLKGAPYHSTVAVQPFIET